MKPAGLMQKQFEATPETLVAIRQVLDARERLDEISGGPGHERHVSIDEWIGEVLEKVERATTRPELAQIGALVLAAIESGDISHGGEDW